MTFAPDAVEEALQEWASSVVDEGVTVIFAGQDGPFPRGSVVTLQVVSRATESEPEVFLSDTAWSEGSVNYKAQVTRRFVGVCDLNAYGEGSLELIELLRDSLDIALVQEGNRSNGLHLRSLGATTDLSEVKGPGFERRYHAELRFAFAEYRTHQAEAVEDVITSNDLLE